MGMFTIDGSKGEGGADNKTEMERAKGFEPSTLTLAT